MGKKRRNKEGERRGIEREEERTREKIIEGRENSVPISGPL